MSLLPLLPRVASVYVSVPVIAPPSNRPENASVFVTVTEPLPEGTGPVEDVCVLKVRLTGPPVTEPPLLKGTVLTGEHVGDWVNDTSV